ncbi:hypothetical protein [Streptomyces pinistramenti]|uniref:hypothetical protein n=1 Tax=Streptomyces pinistramenti TaxID=2884812 RepID=UPI001D06AF37|nr:hypothetical protein [Streptomyces pinistramenti]MCB5911979.1 hypothetical protein [Streptomyces pinistramenti]
MPLNIALTDLAALQARCQIANVRTTCREPRYEKQAAVPSRGWRPLPAAIGRQLAAEPGSASRTLVEIVKPPPPAGPDALPDYGAELGGSDTTYLGQAHSKPGSLTTTGNPANGQLLGLHLDNWDRLPYDAKDTGRRRLCLNLGPGTRYLILCLTNAKALCRAVHPHGYTSRYPHTDDLRAFITAGRQLPCIRIRLDPGDGYIAPTEYLPHDGSTEHQNERSSAVFWLGHWPASALPSLI